MDRSDDPPRHVRLRPPHDTLLGKPGEDAVDDLRRPTNRVQLAGLLDRAQHERHGRDRDDVHPGREKLGVPGNRQVIGLEPDRRAPYLAEPPGEARQEVSLDDLDVDTLDRAGRLGVAPVRHEHDLVRLDEHERVRALEPGQIADVHRVGNQERRDLKAVELRPEAFDAAVQEVSFWS